MRMSEAELAAAASVIEDEQRQVHELLGPLLDFIDGQDLEDAVATITFAYDALFRRLIEKGLTTHQVAAMLRKVARDL